MASGRILVIRGGAIGDFILTLPVLQAIKQFLPEAHVEILGYPNVANLATLCGLAQQAREIEAQAVAGFFARGGQLNEEWMRYFGQFEIIISYLYDPDEIFQKNVERCSKAQFIQGPHRPNEREDQHATQVFLKPLEQLAIFEADDVPQLTLPPKAPAHSLAPSRLILHPGSGSKSKNWPLPRWIELLAQLLSRTNWHVLIVGGEADREEVETLAATACTRRVEVELGRPLNELAQQLTHCEGFVGHDSGISHLCAALGLPGLVLWGLTKTSIWRPNSQQIVIINHQNGLANLPVEQVMARIPPPKSGSPT